MVTNEGICAGNIPMYYQTCLMHLENKKNGKYSPQLITSHTKKIVSLHSKNSKHFIVKIATFGCIFCNFSKVSFLKRLWMYISYIKFAKESDFSVFFLI